MKKFLTNTTCFLLTIFGTENLSAAQKVKLFDDSHIELKNIKKNTEIRALLVHKLTEIYSREIFDNLLKIDVNTDDDKNQIPLRIIYAMLPDLDLFTYSDDKKDTILQVIDGFEKQSYLKLKYKNTPQELVNILKKRKTVNTQNTVNTFIQCVYKPINMALKFSVPTISASPDFIVNFALGKVISSGEGVYNIASDQLRKYCFREDYHSYVQKNGSKTIIKLLQTEIADRLKTVNTKFTKALMRQAEEIDDLMSLLKNFETREEYLYGDWDRFTYHDMENILEKEFGENSSLRIEDFSRFEKELKKYDRPDRALKPTTDYIEFISRLKKISDGNDDNIKISEKARTNLKLFIKRLEFYLENRSFFSNSLKVIYNNLNANTQALAKIVFLMNIQGEPEVLDRNINRVKTFIEMLTQVLISITTFLDEDSSYVDQELPDAFQPQVLD